MSKPEMAGETPNLDSILDTKADAPGGFLARRHFIWAGIVVLAIVSGFWLVLGVSSDGQMRYLTEDTIRGDLTVIVTATGTVQPTNTVDVSSELSGVIRKVVVDFNARVKAGDVLAELDTDKLKAQRDHANATLNAAKAKVEEAQATVAEQKLNFERKRQLLAKQAISRQELDAAKASYDRAIAGLASARAQVAVAEADLSVNETNLAKACICSPVDGVVLKRAVDPGQTVATSFQAPVLFTIAEDLKQMELQVDIDEADVGKVREGQTAFFTVDAYPERRFPARIEQLRFGSEEVEGVVTYKAILRVENEELLLRPGMTATSEILVEEVKDALLIPNAALRFRPPSGAGDSESKESLIGKLLPRRPSFRKPSEHEAQGTNRSVWILRENAPVEMPIVVGATDGARTVVLEGDLAAGQPVIVDVQKAGN